MKIKIIAIALCIFAFLSCKSTVETVRTTIRTDTLREYNTQIDTFLYHDSVFVNQYAKNDTVFLTTYKQRTKYITKFHTDTLFQYQHKTDTLIEKPIIKETKKSKLSKCKNILLGFSLLLNAILLYLCTKKKNK